MTLFSDTTDDDSPIVVESVEINGPGADVLTIDGNGNQWVIGFDPVNSDTTFAVSGLTLTGIRPTSAGVPIPVTAKVLILPLILGEGNVGNTMATISECVITGEGRGIVSFGGGPLTINNSTISNNSAEDEFLFSGFGAGLLFDGNSLIVRDSTFSGNSAAGDENGDGPGGGGIAIMDQNVSNNIDSITAELTNVTISDNETNGFGGGILIDGDPSTDIDVTLRNVTIANNRANIDGADDGAGAGLAADLDGGSSLQLFNVLIAGNSVGAGGFEPDCSVSNGSATSNGFNLVEDPAGCAGIPSGSDITGEDPLLGDLQNNGGFTDTQALGDGSPAINAGGDCPPPSTDQRGISRPQGSACDIGAFEAVVCGDGTRGPGEECDPGVDECCASDCQFAAAGTTCDNGTCDDAGQCVSDGEGDGGCALGSMSDLSILGLLPMLLALAGLALFRRKVG
jgi:hypothetical protein